MWTDLPDANAEETKSGGKAPLQCDWSKLCFSLDWLAASLKFPNVIAFKNWLNLEKGGSLQQAGSYTQIVWL